jgi:type II secretory pathway component PulM
MKNWWAGISLRERIIVLIAAIAVTYMVLDLIIIQPLLSELEQIDKEVVQASDDLSWMQQAVSKLPQEAVKTSRPLQGSIATYVDGQISRSGLKKNLQQMTPIQKHSVRVRLEDVDFNQLLRFLLALEAPIVVDEIRILPQSEAGTVNASLILKNSKAES